MTHEWPGAGKPGFSEDKSSISCVLEYREGNQILATDEAHFPHMDALQEETERSAIHLVEALGVPFDSADWAVRAVDAAGNVLVSITFRQAQQLAATRIITLDDRPDS